MTSSSLSYVLWFKQVASQPSNGGRHHHRQPKRARDASPPRDAVPRRLHGNNSAGRGVAPTEVIFPSSPPVVVLQPGEENKPYALKHPPRQLIDQIGNYISWCKADINTERSRRYIKAVQTTSLAKTESLIMAFAGVVFAYYDLPLESINLSIYSNPTYVARFVGDLQVGEQQK